ncbi:MAG: ATP-binding protein [Dehalococcoidales bacterium]
MSCQHNKQGLWANKHLRYIIAIMALCAFVYYLPAIAGRLGWTGFSDGMNNLHNLWGIDFLGLVFFAPVVYAAYSLGVIPAIMTALVAMIVLLPYAILIDTYPNAMFKPTAFVIILSAVGSVVAMLQNSEQQHHQRDREMKCLYDIGKASGDSNSINEFLGKAVTLIPQALQYPEETTVRITFRDQVFNSPDFQKSDSRVAENLVRNGETIGLLEIYSSRDNPYLIKKEHLTRTISERISAAIRQLELEESQRNYYQQLEKEVDIRTKDLEQVQEKLIRSERLAAVGELASGVGHELRNPLNVIRNCAYLLNLTLTEKSDEEAANTLKVLDKQIDVANKIVTDLLDFTRIRPPAQVKVDLTSLVKESLSLAAPPEQIGIHVNLNGHTPPVRTDPEQMNRVFSNIITNALQAMNGKGGELDIDAAADDSFVSISFKDTGCGIPEENINKIFEPLFTTKPKGIGLGLAISRRLVEQNGGKMEVVSQIGQGTTFTVTLPIEKRR